MVIFDDNFITCKAVNCQKVQLYKKAQNIFFFQKNGDRNVQHFIWLLCIEVI